MLTAVNDVGRVGGCKMRNRPPVRKGLGGGGTGCTWWGVCCVKVIVTFWGRQPSWQLLGLRQCREAGDFPKVTRTKDIFFPWVHEFLSQDRGSTSLCVVGRLWRPATPSVWHRLGAFIVLRDANPDFVCSEHFPVDNRTPHLSLSVNYKLCYSIAERI